VLRRTLAFCAVNVVLTINFVATIIAVWMGIPFVAFTLYAGLTQIPDETMEAAAIDGANPWQRFRDIVVPARRATTRRSNPQSVTS
jgi:ABC-type sugar transport system permease subunit